MAEMEFEVDGVAYRVTKMDVFTQMDVLTKTSPLLAAGFVELLQLIELAKERGLASLADLPIPDLLSMAPNVARELSKMAPADQRFVVTTCLSFCERRTGDGKSWSKVWSAGGSMYDEITADLSRMLRIVWQVYNRTFARFFPVALSL